MATRFRGTPAETRALDAFIVLMRAAEAVAARTQGVATGAGLGMTQFGVLEALLHLGPLYQRELAAKLLRSPANITAVIDNLERKGLVSRNRGEDRRQFTIHLTDEGRGLIESIFPPHVSEIVDVFAALTAAEQEGLTRLCRKLGRAVAEEP